MDTRNIKLNFADEVSAKLVEFSMKNTYEGLIEGHFSGGTDFYMAENDERIALIESGRLKGYYRFEPELVNDVKYEMDFSSEPAEWRKVYLGKCFKDLKASANIAIKGTEGEYDITLEWYLHSQELLSKPLPELIQQMAGRVAFKDIKQYCRCYRWEDLD